MVNKQFIAQRPVLIDSFLKELHKLSLSIKPPFSRTQEIQQQEKAFSEEH